MRRSGDIDRHGVWVRALCALCVLAVTCGRSTSRAPSSLTVSCGSYNRGTSFALVLAAVIEPPRPEEVVLDVDAMGLRTTMTCSAGQRVCVATVAELPAWSMETGSVSVAVEGDLGAGRTRLSACKPDLSAPMPLPEGAAKVGAGTLEVGWEPVPGAAVYVVRFRDLDLGHPAPARPRTLASLATRATHASLSLEGAIPDVAVVEVEAWATDPDAWTAGSSANRSVRTFPIIGAPWALKQPSDFTQGTLTLAVPAGERLAILLLHLDSPFAPAQFPVRAGLRASGTGTASLASARERRRGPTATAAFLGDPVSVAAAPASGVASRTFCTFDHPPPPFDLNNTPNSLATRRRATLALETATALLYVDDEDAAGFLSSDWDALARRWEAAYASVVGRSGAPQDVDGNGKFIVFLTSALGPRVYGVANYFDVTYAADACAPPITSGDESNHADMIHLHPPFGMEDAAGRRLSRDQAWAVVTARMPYALQRMVDANRFRVVEPWITTHNGYPRDLLVTRARMALATTARGTGNHDPSLRALAAPVLFGRGDAGSTPGGYLSISLSDPSGWPSLVASDSFVLYLSDRLGPGFVDRFFATTTTLAQLDAVTGIPFPIAYALWTGALLFSNEPASPWRGFDYLGEDWTPLHEKFMPLEYAPLEAGPAVPVTLRANGFDVYVTGVAGPDGGTVTVTSDDAVKPYVVAIPFRGELP